MSSKMISLALRCLFVMQYFFADSTVSAAPFGMNRCIVHTSTDEAVAVGSQYRNFPSCSNNQPSSDTATVLMGLHQFMSFLQRDVVGPLLDKHHTNHTCQGLIPLECLPSREVPASSSLFDYPMTEMQEIIYNNLFQAVKRYARMVYQVMTNNIVEDGTVDGHLFISSNTTKRTLDILLTHLTSDQVYCHLKRLANDTKPHQLNHIDEACQFLQATNCVCEVRQYTVLEKFHLYVKNEMHPMIHELQKLPL